MSEPQPNVTLAAARSPRGPAWALWTGGWLAVVLVAAKAAMLGRPSAWKWLQDLAVVSWQDVLFAVALAATAAVILRATRRHPRIAAMAAMSFLVLSLVCALYSVVAVSFFTYFHRPMTYDLLRLLDNLTMVRSSVAEHISAPIAIAIVAVPTIFLAMARHGGRHGRAAVAALLGVLATWTAFGSFEYAERTEKLRGGRMSVSPHFVLARSTLVALLGVNRSGLPRDLPPDHLREFATIAERGGQRTSFFVPPPGVERPRNVVVVVLESVATKYLSLYGSSYETTPNLAAESAHALVYDNFYAHVGYTACSFLSINHSVYPGLPWEYLPKGMALPKTIASDLRNKGWRTGYLHSGDLTWAGMRWMLGNMGYETVEDFHELGCTQLTSWGTEDRCMFDRLHSWIDQDRTKPFFAVCWTDQTHDPYARSPGSEQVNFFGKGPAPRHADALSRYLNNLHEADRYIGRLFAFLRERGLADDTLVVVTGDHGESFADPHDHRGHGFALYDEDVHVPLMLWNPKLFPTGQRVATVAGHLDLNPTIADITGHEMTGEWRGYSLFDPQRPARAFFLASSDDYMFGVRENEWKYVINTSSGRELLFNLSRDGTEQVNVAADEPELSSRLRLRIAAWAAVQESILRAAH